MFIVMSPAERKRPKKYNPKIGAGGTSHGQDNPRGRDQMIKEYETIEEARSLIRSNAGKGYYLQYKKESGGFCL